jgi:hypothetical protein
VVSGIGEFDDHLAPVARGWQPPYEAAFGQGVDAGGHRGRRGLGRSREFGRSGLVWRTQPGQGVQRVVLEGL